MDENKVDILKAQLLEFKDARDKINNDIKETNQKMADLIARFKIGDRVIDKSDKEFEVSRINVGEAWRDKSNITITYYGHKVKKDGNLGKLEQQLYEYQDDEYKLKGE